MVCWDCGKNIVNAEERFSCDTCESILCKECYSKQEGSCNDCSSDVSVNMEF